MDRNDILDYLKNQKPYLQEHFHIARLGLFGSFSRDEQTEDSDIDLVYVVEDDMKLSYFQLFELEEVLRRYFKRKVELVNLRFMNPIIKYKAEKDIIYV